jgi:hypothetical protein
MKYAPGFIRAKSVVLNIPTVSGVSHGFLRSGARARAEHFRGSPTLFVARLDLVNAGFALKPRRKTALQQPLSSRSSSLAHAAARKLIPAPTRSAIRNPDPARGVHLRVDSGRNAHLRRRQTPQHRRKAAESLRARA